MTVAVEQLFADLDKTIAVAQSVPALMVRDHLTRIIINLRSIALNQQAEIVKLRAIIEGKQP